MSAHAPSKFMDLLTRGSLEQHVEGLTHVSGHTLDLIITRNNGDLILSRPSVEYYISNHAFVQSHVSVPKPSLET